MKAELKDKIEAARAAVNAAVEPFGYTTYRCFDTQLAEETGEAWFILESTRLTDKPHKDFFEACYYLDNFEDGKRGTIVYGVQGEGDWGDLPADPSAACAAFRKENNNRPLTFGDAEQMARKALVGTVYEDADLVECGGGDGPEDIKPFLIAEKGDVQFGVTVFPDPDGGILFWVWQDGGEQTEFETAADAIAEFAKV